ncbi:uncharacterized protein PV09_05447 [Verruconis gallopava]|uniref:Uncharacterized protein n=1 Tax=Verruconis gallopava TaxID=253628 RepID=A0A0D2A8Y2_9PEZI|nr:uncharacterized protein PV09_05447 [Verruconis gallopava]KIW03223.1 hypothetical protein PV09_05447 [Verruconis gallopava]
MKHRDSEERSDKGYFGYLSGDSVCGDSAIRRRLAPSAPCRAPLDVHMNTSDSKLTSQATLLHLAVQRSVRSMRANKYSKAMPLLLSHRAGPPHTTQPQGPGLNQGSAVGNAEDDDVTLQTSSCLDPNLSSRRVLAPGPRRRRFRARKKDCQPLRGLRPVTHCSCAKQDRSISYFVLKPPNGRACTRSALNDVASHSTQCRRPVEPF